jgi:hypothetical protein
MIENDDGREEEQRRKKRKRREKKRGRGKFQKKKDEPVREGKEKPHLSVWFGLGFRVKWFEFIPKWPAKTASYTTGALVGVGSQQPAQGFLYEISMLRVMLTCTHL